MPSNQAPPEHPRSEASIRTVRQRNLPRRLYLCILTRNCACTHLSRRQWHVVHTHREGSSLGRASMMVEGCRVFADYVSKHNGHVPKWVVAAFWWLSYAVDGSLSSTP